MCIFLASNAIPPPILSVLFIWICVRMTKEASFWKLCVMALCMHNYTTHTACLSACAMIQHIQYSIQNRQSSSHNSAMLLFLFCPHCPTGSLPFEHKCESVCIQNGQGYFRSALRIHPIMPNGTVQS